jgi:hypothetical protein
VIAEGLRHHFPGDVMNSFVKLAIDPHGRLNRETLSRISIKTV